MASACDECLYTDRKIVSDERRQEILDRCDDTDTHFVCHKASLRGHDVMCRAHWERTKDRTFRNVLAQHLGVVRFVAVEDLADRSRPRRGT